MLIDMVCLHPAIPLASDLLLPLLPDEEPSIDKEIELAETISKVLYPEDRHYPAGCVDEENRS